MVVGDGVIGNTKSFGDLVPASNAGPRARAENEALALGGSASLVAPVEPTPLFNSSLIPAPCRLCAGPSYLTDELGAIHSCCELNWDSSRCISCDTSESLNREHRRRGIRPGWKEVKAEGLDG